MPKRSIRVADCNTSVSLENEFWDGLKEMAALRRQSLPHLITEIDSCRMRGNLSSALRIAVLEFYQQPPSRTPPKSCKRASCRSD